MRNPYQSVGGSLIQVLERVQDVHEDMTIGQLMFLLAIAANPDLQQRDLYKLIPSADGVASRRIAVLSEIGNRGTPGLGLISTEIDPSDRRNRILNLTPRGKRLLDDIVATYKRGA